MGLRWSIILRRVCTFALLLVLSGCGTVRLYEGPSRGEENVAILTRKCITSSVTGLGDSYLDGVLFCLDDIEMLPGDHHLRVFRDEKGTPYDCHVNEEFDSYGWNNCLNEQREAAAKGQSYAGCYTSTYTKVVTNCAVPRTRHTCEQHIQFRAGTHYVLKSGGSGNAPMLVYNDHGGEPITVPCILTNNWVTRENS
jgi:hypothetical protein